MEVYFFFFNNILLIDYNRFNKRIKTRISTAKQRHKAQRIKRMLTTFRYSVLLKVAV